MKDNFVIHFNVRSHICCNLCIEIECLSQSKFYENEACSACLTEKHHFFTSFNEKVYVTLVEVFCITQQLAKIITNFGRKGVITCSQINLSIKKFRFYSSKISLCMPSIVVSDILQSFLILILKLYIAISPKCSTFIWQPFVYSQLKRQ